MARVRLAQHAGRAKGGAAKRCLRCAPRQRIDQAREIKGASMAERRNRTTGEPRKRWVPCAGFGRSSAPIAPWWCMAVLALIVTASVSLIMPMAVRRVVDGFCAGNVQLLDTYFGAALLIAALLALGTGVRYYFVTRLGERVVTDIRRALFDRVMGMSPAYFEHIMTGEVVSRITTDTTLILSVIGSSVSIALRNLLDAGGRAGAAGADFGQADRPCAADRARRGGADHRAGPPPAQPQPRQSGLDRAILRQGRRGAGRRANRAGLHPAMPTRARIRRCGRKGLCLGR